MTGQADRRGGLQGAKIGRPAGGAGAARCPLAQLIEKATRLKAAAG
ncbi:hypothetical protein MJ561_15520 [Klebsiella pneumoniae]|nr:hypothetical protein MJ561_15520 [Klebsiella pneumoniae]